VLEASVPTRPDEAALLSLLRADIAELEEYTPIVPLEILSRRLGIPQEHIVKLDANENPYGPAPTVYEALSRYRYYHIYPDPDQTLLREAIESYIGIPKEQVIFGNGSDELIDLSMRLFLMPGDLVVNLPPTFGMYSYNATLCGGRVISVRRREDFSVDVEGIERAVSQHDGAVKMLFINSPNNPDGSLIPEDELRRLLRLPLIVVLDEAYAEFSGRSYVSWVLEHWNLIVLRTFSKWAGLGGLRIGYGAFPSGIARQLWKIKPPYSVNVAAQVAALESLRARELLMANVQRIVAERERLYAELSRLPGVKPYPSAANFILCRLLRVDAADIAGQLAQRGILVRHYDKEGIRDCLRITVGTPDQNNALLQALCDLLMQPEQAAGQVKESRDK
jgi:histidinol-phosphate aminotransferase